MVRCYLSFLFALYSVVSVSVAEEFKVGVILPMTGDAASVAQAVRNGITLGLEKISLEQRNKIKFIFEDDGLQPKNSISALNKLVAHDNIDLLVNVSSGTGKALSTFAEQRKLPFIAIASDPKIVEKKKYVFNFWVTPDEESRLLVPEAIRRGYKKIARISTLHDGAISQRAAFDKINNGKLEVVLDDEYSVDVKDFKAFLTKVRARGDVDAILSILIPGQCGLFAKQARRMGFGKDIFGYEMFEDANEVKLSEGSLVGQWYVNSGDVNGEFIELYRKRFPQASVWIASNGHDVALLIGDAIAKGFGRKNFHEYLSTLKDFTGVLGTYSASGDNRFTLPAAIKQVTATGFEKVH